MQTRGQGLKEVLSPKLALHSGKFKKITPTTDKVTLTLTELLKVEENQESKEQKKEGQRGLTGCDITSHMELQ